MIYKEGDTPSEETHDFYIGRTVIGSEPIVKDLMSACQNSLVVSYDDTLVLPLMPRRMLSTYPDPIGKLVGILETLKDIPPSEEVICIEPDIQIVNKPYSGSYSIKLPFTKLTENSTIQQEAACIGRGMDPPYRKGMPVVLRLLETRREHDVVPLVTKIISWHFNGEKSQDYQLSIPILCAVTKK